ncbi:MAG: pseudouridine synthase [Cytophagales bacterium]
MRLNQYIAHTGVCSRRKAEALIRNGKISVNGKVVTNLAHQVGSTDRVRYRNQPILLAEKCYYLLHKPFNVVTTLQDPQGRKTVLDLLKHRIKTRVYPVGRLDRNTTGVLLLTNDGALAKALAHPAHGVPKIYDITLKKPLQPTSLAQLKKGVVLADGFVQPDAVAWSQQRPKSVQVTLHSGKNRVLRRIFATLGHQIIALERIAYGGLTAIELAPGQWRALTPAEVADLKKWQMA